MTEREPGHIYYPHRLRASQLHLALGIIEHHLEQLERELDDTDLPPFSLHLFATPNCASLVPGDIIHLTEENEGFAGTAAQADATSKAMIEAAEE